MKYLFVHQNFPGQWRHCVNALAADARNEVVALTMNQCAPIPGLRIVRHWPDLSSRPCPTLLGEYDLQIRRGESAAAAARVLREQGFAPDLICVHPGWGEGLFLKTIFPEAKMLAYQEFYYRHGGPDVSFDPEYPSEEGHADRHLQVRNSVFLQSLGAADWNVSPTCWQRSQFPEHLQGRITVQHEGVDTQRLRPDPGAWIALENGTRKLTAQDEVITYVARNLEPYRGFHTFARALPELLRRRPEAHIVVVGGDEVSYGRRLEHGTYRQRYIDLSSLGADAARVVFVGQIPYSTYVNLLQISSAHIYLTYPFVLSWSMLEAMSVGVPLIASRTAPVEEVVQDGHTGMLVDFFSPAAIAEAVDSLLEDRQRALKLSKAARCQMIEEFDLGTRALPAYLDLLKSVAAGQAPA